MHPDYARIYAVVAQIPRGRVATYGMIAALAGLPGRARQVGYALHSVPPGFVIPWQRVINARGEISLPGESGARQRALLAAEGVELEGDRVSLARYTWRPGQTKPAAKSKAAAKARAKPAAKAKATAKLAAKSKPAAKAKATAKTATKTKPAAKANARPAAKAKLKPGRAAGRAPRRATRSTGRA